MSERWIRLLDPRRLGAAHQPAAPTTEARTDYQRDFDRIVFSTAFRRLHDKTQVFPLPENDLVHSRLTHSLEVSCVGRSLGTAVGQRVTAAHPELLRVGLDARAFGDIVAAACVAHDLGNPPFGHAGEDAIGAWFRENRDVTAELPEEQRQDLERFEGNAQGFRILTRLQIPENPGLQLTMSTIAAFVKYPRTSGPRPGPGAHLKKHGVFRADVESLAEVAAAVGLSPAALPEGMLGFGRHPLAFLMEAADDICYAILDIEDGFRLGHVAYSEVAERLEPIAARGRNFRSRQPSSKSGQKEAIAYLRAKAINQLAFEVTAAFLQRERALIGGELEHPLSELIPSSGALQEVKEFTRKTCYEAKEVVEIELAGYEVLSALLSAFVPAALADRPSPRERKLLSLLPEPPKKEDSGYERLLLVTDHLSGMTDRYAIATYRKLLGITTGRS